MKKIHIYENIGKKKKKNMKIIYKTLKNDKIKNNI